MTDKERRRVLKALNGLLAIAAVAVPNSYWSTDTRIALAVKLKQDLTPAGPRGHNLRSHGK